MIFELIKQMVEITHPFTLTIIGIGFYISYKYLNQNGIQND